MKLKGIMLKLLLLIVVPLILLACVVTAVAVTSMQAGMQEETIEGLSELVTSVNAAFEAIDDADYKMVGDDLYKGSLNVSDATELIDSFTEGHSVDVTIFYGDTRMATSLKDISTGQRIVGTKASAEVIETVLKKGETYSSTNLQINGENYYVYYMPVKDADGTISGMVFAGKPSTDIDELISSRTTIIVVVSLVMVIIVVICAILIVSRIAKAIIYAENQIAYISRGELDKVKINDKFKKRKDEIGLMARGLEALWTELKKIVGDIKTSSEQLLSTGQELGSMSNQTSTNAEEINRAIEDISKGAVSQAEESESASNQIRIMGDNIDEITDEMRVMDQSSEEMAQAGEESVKIIEELSVSNDRTTEAIGKVGEQIRATDDSVNHIKEAVNLITAIAEETNLLSLNASIEAARAGEAGRGFAVVAGQIQKLAEESNNSAQRIEEVIRRLLEDSKSSIEIMENVEKMVNEQQIKLNETKERFIKVNEGIHISRQQTAKVTIATEKCENSKAVVEDVIENLSAISQENAASTQETTASMEELNATISMLAEQAERLRAVATTLNEEVDFFKI